jgi:3D (Asp-Asp-Asp) domain-containing protein
MALARFILLSLILLVLWGQHRSITANQEQLITIQRELRDVQQVVDEVYAARKFKLTATAYSGSPDETDSDPDKTALMTKPVAGRTVAVSRDLIHWLGHKVYIKGKGVYMVEDLMNARFTKKIDFFYGSKQEAIKFGVRTVDVVLLN